mmetsp:Transcript_14509/g.25513  ORF Transcript_14509/g.25513 Transcript_14509/m.25513 type:complete len:94 (+) Transcript_14509:2015-2296(+)
MWCLDQTRQEQCYHIGKGKIVVSFVEVVSCVELCSHLPLVLEAWDLQTQQLAEMEMILKAQMAELEEVEVEGMLPWTPALVIRGILPFQLLPK